jgi:hypothetical protein
MNKPPLMLQWVAQHMWTNVTSNPSTTEDETPEDEASAGVVCGFGGNKKEMRLWHQLILVPIKYRAGKQALVDSGATHSGVSEEFAEKHDLPIEEGKIKK